MELWLKKIFILFPWILLRVVRPILSEDHPSRDWTWTSLAEHGTDILYFFAGCYWFSILLIILCLKIIF
jgi:hypothetical protein